jgi:outer membrane biogenesis lipoprotein LolB
MKSATVFLAALLLAGSVLASAIPARAEDETDATWQAHIEQLRHDKHDLE